MPLKPLIKVSHLKTSSFLQVPCVYSLPQTFKIKKYLPKFLSFQGVVADGDYSKSELEKEKIKLFDSVDNLKFYKINELTCRLWQNVAVCVNIPVNNRLKAEEEKVNVISYRKHLRVNQNNILMIISPYHHTMDNYLQDKVKRNYLSKRQTYFSLQLK